MPTILINLRRYQKEVRIGWDWDTIQDDTNNDTQHHTGQFLIVYHKRFNLSLRVLKRAQVQVYPMTIVIFDWERDNRFKVMIDIPIITLNRSSRGECSGNEEIIFGPSASPLNTRQNSIINTLYFRSQSDSFRTEETIELVKSLIIFPMIHDFGIPTNIIHIALPITVIPLSSCLFNIYSIDSLAACHHHQHHYYHHHHATRRKCAHSQQKKQLPCRCRSCRLPTCRRADRGDSLRVGFVAIGRSVVGRSILQRRDRRR